jgi:hypothetical protein
MGLGRRAMLKERVYCPFADSLQIKRPDLVKL